MADAQQPASADDPLPPEIVVVLDRSWTAMLAAAGADREVLYIGFEVLAAAFAPLPIALFDAAIAPVDRAAFVRLAGKWLRVGDARISLVPGAVAPFLVAELGNAAIEGHLRIEDALVALRDSGDPAVIAYRDEHERDHRRRCLGLGGAATWVYDVDILVDLAASGKLVEQLELVTTPTRELELVLDVARRHQQRWRTASSSLPAQLWTELVARGLARSWVAEQLRWRELLPPMRLRTQLTWPDCATRVLDHESQVCTCAIDDAATRALTGSSRGQLLLWSLETGEILHEFALERWIESCALTPDAARAAACFESTVVLLDLANRRELGRHQAHKGDVAAVSISADGRTVVSADEHGVVMVWRVDRDRQDRLGSHRARVRKCSLSDDGSLAITGDEDQRAMTWDVAAGTLLRVLDGHDYDVNAVAIAADGSRAISLCIARARVWNPRTGELLHDHRSMGISARQCVLVDGGKSVLVADYSEELHRWSVDDGMLEARHIAHSDDIMGVAATRDGAWYLTCGGDNKARLWQRDRVGAGVVDRAAITALVPAADRRSVWVSNGREGVRRVRLDDGVALETIGDQTVHGIAEHDGKLALVGSGRRVDVFELALDARHTSWKPSDDWLRACVVEPDGRRLAYAGDDGHVYVSNFAGQKLVKLSGSKDWVRVLAWIVPGRLISADDDGELRVWDVDRERCLAKHEPTGGTAIHALALDGRGERAAIGGTVGKLMIIDLDDGDVRQRFDGHEGRVAAVCWARDDRLLISAGEDACLRVWDVERGELLHRFDAPFALTRLVLVNAELIAGDVAGNLLIFDVDWSRIGLKRTA